MSASWQRFVPLTLSRYSTSWLHDFIPDVGCLLPDVDCLLPNSPHSSTFSPPPRSTTSPCIVTPPRFVHIPLYWGPSHVQQLRGRAPVSVRARRHVFDVGRPNASRPCPTPCTLLPTAGAGVPASPQTRGLSWGLCVGEGGSEGLQRKRRTSTPTLYTGR